MSYTEQKPAFKRRPSILFNDYRQPLPETIEPINGGKFPAQLQWEISGDKDKVFLKINDGVFGRDDNNSKLKSIEMGWLERNMFFQTLTQAATDKEFTSAQFQVFDKSFSGGERLPLRATFTVIRGKSGEIRVHYRRSTYEAVFVMGSKRHVINKKDEQGKWAFDPGLSSAFYTLSFVEFSSRFFDDNEVTNFKPRERKDSGQNNNFSGGQNNNFNNPSTILEDDGLDF